MRSNFFVEEDSGYHSALKPFDFERYSWPPKDWNKDTTRFATSFEYLSKGACRSVYFAVDTKTNQPLVLKKFTTENPKEQIFWKEDINASKEAQNIATKFNIELQPSKSVRFIQPIVDYYSEGSQKIFVKGETMLVEPYLGRHYIKFNSNSGWQADENGLTMGALSHFSYHKSGGKLLLCDLQGVKINDEYILTDPAICSISQSFGLTDLGYEGIVSFFKHHKCNLLCDSKWIKPKMGPCRLIPTAATRFCK